MNEKQLIEYYNKFNEDKRFNSRHGKVEFITTMKYINDYLKHFKKPKILDIGAGTGSYSVPLSEKGYDVTAVELVKHNLRVIEKKNSKIKTILGNAINLNMLEDNVFDIVLLFGPMYHLISFEEKIKALSEAKRVTKNGGVIMAAYVMNDYAIIKHGFIDNYLLESRSKGLLDDNFQIKSKEEDLYSYIRISEIDKLNKEVNLKRLKIISPDGPANYIRKTLNEMDDKTFDEFIKYNLEICERKDLLGASAHTLDILKKQD